MKKAIIILLSLLLVLSMAACGEKKATEPETKVVEEPVATQAPTPVPTEAPTPTPAPTEVPTEVIVADALGKLSDLKSLRMDMMLLMDLDIKVSAQGMNIELPVQMNMNYLMDVQKDPSMVKMDVKMEANLPGAGQQTNTALVYMDLTGEKPVGYSSVDEGATWTVEEDGDMEKLRPQDIPDFLQHAKDFQKQGTEIVDGREVTVYVGKLDKEYAQQIMTSTGMEEMLSEITSSDDAPEGAAAQGDILVTVSIDNETGYPVRYSVDMTDMLRDALTSALKAAMGMGDTEGVDFQLDVSAIRVDSVLSQFDSVEPIVIPEAALNKPLE